jgi:hypothetical protein
LSPTVRCYEMEPPKGYKVERREIARLIKLWAPLFGLDHYTFYWWLVDGMEQDDPEHKIWAWASMCADQENLAVKLYVNLRFFTVGPTLPGIQPLSVIIGHEVFHAVMSEVWDPLLTELNLMLVDHYPDEVRGLFAKRVSEAHERAARHVERALERMVA